MSIVCVPEVPDRKRATTPRIATVLAATDFSEFGNAAVAYALALAPAEARVIVVHVTEKGDRNKLLEDLNSIASQTGTSRKVEAHVLEADHVSEAICQAAEREDAGILCLGSRGRSGLPKLLLGSVSQEVLLRTHRPVLLVRSQPPPIRPG